VCGTVVISGIPIGVAWRMGGHKWSLLFGKVLLGLALVGALWVAEHVWHLPHLIEPVLAIVFLAVWWLLNRADFARLPIPNRLRRKRT
jgi:putative peptidoglycan lipid II flippase